MSPASRARWSGARLLAAGLALLVLGTGPLLTIVALSSLGRVAADPNPMGPGLLAFFSFWPAVGISAVGIKRIIAERVRNRSQG